MQSAASITSLLISKVHETSRAASLSAESLFLAPKEPRMLSSQPGCTNTLRNGIRKCFRSGNFKCEICDLKWTRDLKIRNTKKNWCKTQQTKVFLSVIVGKPETKLLVRDNSVWKANKADKDGEEAAREFAWNLIRKDLREHGKAWYWNKDSWAWRVCLHLLCRSVTGSLKLFHQLNETLVEKWWTVLAVWWNRFLPQDLAAKELRANDDK